MRLKSTANQHATLLLFGLTMFLSAGLMFGVQPMVGKMLLPIVGGTPAGWIVAMAFFQVALLAGYLFAHLLRKMPVRAHAIVYIAALLAGAMVLPVTLRPDAATATPGPVDIFVLLTFAVALPFIALSATSSTVQRMFTASGHPSAGDPYFLYAASNLGSFAGLLLYPFVVEPFFPLGQQSGGLSFLYAAVIVAGGLCLLQIATTARHATDKPSAVAEAPVGWRRYLEWGVLAFFPSSLLLGVTIYITTDLISAPMIWVLPLCLYLLTFILAFRRRQVLSLKILDRLQPWLVFGFMLFTSLSSHSWAAMVIALAIFFLVALQIHSRLASLRPLDSQRHHLTGFYLMMSVGGALGGILNAFVIPFILKHIAEFSIVLLASLLLNPLARQGRKFVPAFILSLAAAITLITIYRFNLPPYNMGWEAIASIFGMTVLAAIWRPEIRPAPYLAFASILVFLMVQLTPPTERTEIFRLRNFYGLITVYDSKNKKEPGMESSPFRVLQHGTTLHGIQFTEPEYQNIPLSYYTKKGPVGDIFTALAPKKVAAIGLGTGALNCHTETDRSFTFFEIDPDMADVAREYFTYLSACKNKTEPRIIIGDGRLEIGKLQDEKFDLIVVDVFTSDSIPVHVSTLEAMEIYKERLAEGGAIAFHTSSRYFSLWNVIAATAQAAGLENKAAIDFYANAKEQANVSTWMILYPAETDKIARLKKKGWFTIKPPAATKSWTDQFSNPISVMSQYGGFGIVAE